MIDETIRTFDYCIDKANQYQNPQRTTPKKHLILGNGFSIALFPNIFSYTSLAGLVQTPQINNLFNGFGTKDFEHVMRRLTYALEVVNIYQKNSPLSIKIENDIVELRRKLIDAISQSHPENPMSITPDQYENCRVFLNHFESGNKYTFNYDLLLYWVYMKFLYFNDINKRLKMKDGFGNSTYNNRTILAWNANNAFVQNVYHLHGAMYLFNKNGIISKLSSANRILSIREQVCRSIGKGKYPMFISEGTKDHKRSRIQNSAYLKYTFDSLDKIDDNLFIFGHSLGDTDDHVFERVNSQSNLKNIFISIHGDINSADNQIIVNKVSGWERLNSNKHYYFYDAADANVWGP